MKRKKSYLIRTVTAGMTVEIYRTQSARYGCHDSHASKANPTTHEMEKYNARRAADRVRQLINCNFKNDDYHLTLKYFKDYRPKTAEEAAQHLKSWLRRIKRELEKAGVEIKYIYAKPEVGERGAIHHHIIMNAVDLKVLRRQWQQHGTIHLSPLYSDGQYEYLAQYIIKQTKEGHIGWRYVASKNLKKPKETVRRVSAARWRAEPKCPKGYRFDPDFPLENGVCAVTGYAYQRYGLIRLEPPKPRRPRPKPSGKEVCAE